MKKRNIFIAAAVVIVIAVALFLVLRARREIVLTEITPPGVVFFAELKNLEDNWERLAASGFWKELLASSLWRESGWGERVNEISRKIEKDTAIVPSRSNVMQLIGRDAAAALIHPDEEGTEITLLLLSRVGLRARALELVSRMGDRLQGSDKRALVEEEYRGKKLVLIKPSTSFPFYAAYTFVGNYLALTLSQDEPPSVLRKVIDLASRRGESIALAEEKTWRTFRKFSLGPETDGNFYLDVKRLFRLGGADGSAIKISGELTRVEGWNEMVKKLEELGGIFESLSAEFKWGKELKSRILISLNSQKIEETYGKDFLSSRDRVQAGPETAGFVPSGSIFYLSAQNDFALLWGKIKELLIGLELDSVKDFLEGLQSWEEEAGVRLEEDVLAGLGNSAALALENVATGILLPVPEAVFIFRVDDRPLLADSMEKIALWLAAKYRLVPRKKDVSGVAITSVPLPVIAQPAYAFLGDYLLISSTRDLLGRIINIRRGGGASLTSDAAYQNVVAELKGGGGAFAYLNDYKMSECLLRTGNWWIGMEKLISQEKSKKKEILFRKKLVPLLNLLKVFKFSGWKKYVEGDVVIQDFYWYIEDKIIPAE